MKARRLLLPLALLLAVSARAMTVTTNLFVEGFSTIGKSDSSLEGRTYLTGGATSEGDFSTSGEENGWHGKSVCIGPHAIRFGNASNDGWARTRTIVRLDDATAGPVKVSFRAAAHPSSGNQTLTLTLLDSSDATIAGTEQTFGLQRLADANDRDIDGRTTDTNGVPLVATFASAPSSFKVRFQGRYSFLGEVRVSQTYDDGRIQLATPVVSVSPDVHHLLLFFSSVDEHATGFELEVLDPEGRDAGTQQLYPGFGFMVTDLEEGTSYMVRLRAVGDGVTYASSEWYEEQISTTTDNWQPVWTIGTPDPVPTIGRAFSFGVSAALANGTPQTVAFNGLTPVPTGAQPTFADGVFSWTPGEGAAGSYEAAFSVVNQGGTYATNVEFRVRGSTEAAVLFFEPFSGSANNTTSWASTAQIIENGAFIANIATNAGWTGTTGLRKAPSAILFGTATSAKGSATSPAVFLRNGVSSGTATISFHAATKNANRSLSMSVLDGEGAVVESRTFALATVNTSASNLDDDAYSVDASGNPLSATLSVPSPFRLFFEPAQTDSCLFLDSVKVTQQVSTSLEDLGAPADLAVVGGTLSTNSFSVAWTPVANATNYAVEVYVTGETVALATMDFAAPPAALAGLSDDTDYTVRVRAEGDTERYNYSPWASVSARTLRSALNPTLTVGPWSNAAGEDRLYGVIRNTAAVSAELDDHTPVDVVLADIAPAPSRSPALADGTLSWTPAEADEGTTFTLTFAMTPAAGVVYETNVSFKVLSLPGLHPPAVAVAEPVDWNRIVLSWDVQYRATRYGVRVWTGGPNPDATATRVEEHFERWPTNRPFGWTFGVKKSDEVYSGTAAPVKLSEDGHFMETYDLGGTVSSVSFHAVGHSMTGGSTLSVVGIAEDETETPLGTVSDLGSVQSGTNCTFAVPAGAGVRRVAWRYAKINGGVGVGTVVIEGTGFATAKFLPGWGPTEKNVGLVQSCTVAKPRPGRYLGVNPANKKEDLTEPCVNYAEVQVRDAAGTTFATIVAVPVPAPPRSARATLMILK